MKMKRRRDGECSGCDRELESSMVLDLERFIEGSSGMVQRALDIRNMSVQKSLVYN
jgi:hypothetical protein